MIIVWIDVELVFGVWSCVVMMVMILSFLFSYVGEGVVYLGDFEGIVLFILYFFVFWFFLLLWMLNVDDVFDLIVFIFLKFGDSIFFFIFLVVDFGCEFLLWVVMMILGWCVKGLWIGMLKILCMNWVW